MKNVTFIGTNMDSITVKSRTELILGANSTKIEMDTVTIQDFTFNDAATNLLWLSTPSLTSKSFTVQNIYYPK